MLRLLLFFISFAMLVSSLMAVLAYWGYDEMAQDVAALMLRRVSVAQIEQQIAESIQQDNPSDARMYMEIARSFAYPIDENKFLPAIEALEVPWLVARRHATHFASGFIEGEGRSVAGVAGAISADFTVIGDVRDLYEQYQRHQAGQAVNELVVALAGVGVGLTAVTVASSGTGASVKTGVSTLKMAARTGRLTPSFQQQLMRQANDVFDHQHFLTAIRQDRSADQMRRAALSAFNAPAAKHLNETAQSVNQIRRSTSLVDTLELMPYVSHINDLRRLERVSSRYGHQTKGIFKLLGKSAIGTVRVWRRATELLLALGAVFLSLLANILSLSSLLAPRSKKVKGSTDTQNA